jgi:hypothetical protein
LCKFPPGQGLKSGDNASRHSRYSIPDSGS